MFISQEILAQDSLERWKINLEARLKYYSVQRDQLNKAIEASIDISPKITSDNNRRTTTTISTGTATNFKELTIDDKIYLDRYSIEQIFTKANNFLRDIRHQVAELHQVAERVAEKIKNNSDSYILKDRPTIQITSTKRFLNPIFITTVHSATNVQLGHINNSPTIVSNVIESIFGPNSWTDHAKYDRSGRLYFEGTKTFHDEVVFQRNLSSACCNRLQPFGNINYLMTKTTNQTVDNPMIVLRSKLHFHSVTTNRLENVDNVMQSQGTLHQQRFKNTQSKVILKPDKFLFIRQNIKSSRNQSLNLIIRNSPIVIHNAHSINSFISINEKQLHIEKDPHYLVHNREHQKIGTAITFGRNNFYNKLDCQLVNGVDQFSEFVRHSLVRVDKNAIIPNLIFKSRPQSVITVYNRLRIGDLNGIKIPQAIMTAGQLSTYNSSILVRGCKRFLSNPHFTNIVVTGKTSNLILPQEILTISQDDRSRDIAAEKVNDRILFSKGIHLLSGMKLSEKTHFDMIGPIRQNVATPEVFLSRSINQGTNVKGIISFPLIVSRLDFTNNLNQINNIAIQDLNGTLMASTIHHSGMKRFESVVEVDHCHISAINYVKNWMEHLIAIKDTRSPQIIYTSLVFSNLLPTHITVNQLTISGNASKQQVYLDDTLELLNRVLRSDAHDRRTSLSIRYRSLRLLDRLEIKNPLQSKINNIFISDVMTVNSSSVIRGRVTLSGGIITRSHIVANRVQTNYAIGQTDLVSFYLSRVAIFPWFDTVGRSNRVIALNKLVLDSSNGVNELYTNNFNYQLFLPFIDRILSKSRPQIIKSRMRFENYALFESDVFTKDNRGLVNKFRFSNLKLSSVTFEDGLNVSEIIAIPESRIICDRLSQTNNGGNNSSKQSSKNSSSRATMLYPHLMEETLMKRGSFFMKGNLTSFNKLIVLGNVHVKLVNGLKLSQRYLLNSTARSPFYRQQSEQVIRNYIIFDNDLNITGNIDLWTEAPKKGLLFNGINNEGALLLQQQQGATDKGKWHESDEDFDYEEEEEDGVIYSNKTLIIY